MNDKVADTISVALVVNRSLHRLQLDPRATLLDTLRERIGLIGAKKDCDHGQCSACIMSAIACVKEGHAKSEDEKREYMSGNLCRCGAYVGIVAAIQSVAGRAG
jgi:aerobic-type carbon monoxide dehydrogenase small subunit (CoxS/CutS family)